MVVTIDNFNKRSTCHIMGIDSFTDKLTFKIIVLTHYNQSTKAFQLIDNIICHYTYCYTVALPKPKQRNFTIHGLNRKTRWKTLVNVKLLTISPKIASFWYLNRDLSWLVWLHTIVFSQSRTIGEWTRCIVFQLKGGCSDNNDNNLQ